MTQLQQSLEFRNALAQFPSGVTITTTRADDGTQYGFTASAFCSLSLEPPLVLVCLQKDADCFAAFETAQSFAVTILRDGQADIARRFATKGIEKFEGLEVEASYAGPMIVDAAAYVACETFARYEGGDHVILVGLVTRARSAGAEPLLHYNRRFGHFLEDRRAPDISAG